MAIIKKSDLKRRLAERFPDISVEDCDLSVDCLLEFIAEQIGLGNRLEIRNFGSFKPKYRTARLVRNPKTGEKVPKLDRVLPSFKGSLSFRKKLNATAEKTVESLDDSLK